MLGMTAWGIELCYLAPLEFIYLYICFKKGSGKRAVMDRYTGSILRFQILFVVFWVFFPIQRYSSVFLLFLISVVVIFHDKKAL